MHIIDGQQRIVTIVLTYAILYHMIHEHFDKDIPTQRKKEELDSIRDRFTWQDEDQRRLLLGTSGKSSNLKNLHE